MRHVSIIIACWLAALGTTRGLAQAPATGDASPWPPAQPLYNPPSAEQQSVQPPPSPVYRDSAVQPALAEQPIAVSPRAAASQQPRLAGGDLPSLAATAASLMLVLGLFVFCTWWLRRAMPRGARVLPADVVEVLGRTPLAARQQAHLLRVGNKLLLVAVSPGVTETLCEVTDREEVERIVGLCRAAESNSSTRSFQEIFRQFGRERAGRDFAGAEQSQLELANRGQASRGEDADA